MEEIKFEKVPVRIFDKVKTNKEEFVEKFIDELEELFPETVKDGKVDFQALLERFGEYQDRNERYELTWVGKDKARQESFEDIVGKTLKYIEEDSKNPEITGNLYIEGDNLEVLKLLRKSYYGKIKMIYIDPPYNTGNDFVYKDDFTMSKEEYDQLKGDVDEYGNRLVKNSADSGRYHSNWLSMMYPRLQVARDLLTEDGVIFISIDDNEVHNLRKICDEIFRDKNFVEVLKWKRKKQPSFLGNHTAKMMEYVLVYAKDKEQLEKLSIENISDSTKKVINISNPEAIRVFKPGVEVKGIEDGIIEAGRYIIRTMEVEYLTDVIIEESKTINEIKVLSRFSVSQDNIDKFIDEKLLYITAQKGLRRYVSEAEKDTRKSITDLLLEEWGDNQESDKQFIEIFGEKLFETPKPIELIYNLTSSIYTEENIILDFFSGSATTAHAVMNLNAEDGRNRKFIMVQLPETTDEKSEANKKGYKTITEIGKERIRRAGEKILEDYKDKEGIENLDIGFKVFKVENTNFRRIKKIENNEVESNMKSLSEKDLEDFNPHFTDLDIVYELMLRRQDIELTEEIKKLENIGDRTFIVGDTMLVCLEEKVTEEIVEKIGIINTDLSWIILRDSAFDDDCDLKVNTTRKLRTIIKESKKKDQKIYWI